MDLVSFSMFILEPKFQLFFGTLYCLLIWVEMSLTLFAVRNQWYKNGKNEPTQASGGSLRSPTESSGNRPTMPWGSKDAFFPTNFTISVSKCSTAPISKALTWQTWSVSTQRPTAVMATATRVHHHPCSFIRNVQRFPRKHHQLRRLLRYVDCCHLRYLSGPRFVQLLHSLVLE